MPSNNRANNVSNEVTERRLRPIYEFLDNGFPKKALQEADKVLKKSRDLPCAMALKAIALIRIGRRPDAEHVIEDLNKLCPADEATLQAMSLCYRELNKVDMIAQLYENAVKQAPGNEELLSALFMAYVRMPNHFQEQHTTAQSLYKAAPKQPYYFWSVMSLYLKAIYQEKKEVAERVTLVIAQKLVERLIDKESIESEQESILYTLILERRGEFAKLREFLNSPLGAKMTDYCGQIEKRKIKVDVALQDYRSAFTKLQTYIERHPDDYLAYMDLIETALRLESDATTDTTNAANGVGGPDEGANNDTTDSALNQVVQFIAKHSEFNDSTLSSMASLSLNGDKNKSPENSPIPNHPTPRAPWMARIEFCSRLMAIDREKNKGNLLKDLLESANSSTELSDLFVEYFKQFSHKPVCLIDLTYLFHKCHQQDPQLVSQIVTKLMAVKQDLITGDPFADSKEMQRLSAFYYMLTYVGHYKSCDAEERIQLAIRLIDCYEAAGKLCDAGDGSIDHLSRDSFAVLAAHHLIHGTASSSDVTTQNEGLIRAIWLLVRAVNVSRHNHRMVIMLANIYMHIGSCAPAFHLYRSLDVKHIQHDTMAYLMDGPLLASGLYVLAGPQLDLQSRFYLSNLKDGLEHLVGCYRYGTFDKIIEMVDMRNILISSVQNLYTTLAKMYSQLLRPTSSSELLATLDEMESLPEVKWDSIETRRDFRLFIRFEHSDSDDLAAAERLLFERDIKWLKIRYTLMRGIFALRGLLKIDPSTPTAVNGDVDTKHMNSDHLCDQVQAHLTELGDMEIGHDSFQTFVMNGPMPPMSSEYSREPHLKLLTAHLRYVIESNQFLNSLLNQRKDGDIDENSKSSPDWQSLVSELSSLSRLIISDLVERVTSMSGLGNLRETLHGITCMVESFSLSVSLLSLLSELIKPLIAASKRKSKKKSFTIPNEFLESFNQLITVYSQVSECELPDLVTSFLDRVKLLVKVSETSESDSPARKALTQLLDRVTVDSVSEKSIDGVIESIIQSFTLSTNSLNGVLMDKTRLLSSLKM